MVAAAAHLGRCGRRRAGRCTLRCACSARLHSVHRRDARVTVNASPEEQKPKCVVQAQPTARPARARLLRRCSRLKQNRVRAKSRLGSSTAGRQRTWQAVARVRVFAEAFGVLHHLYSAALPHLAHGTQLRDGHTLLRTPGVELLQLRVAQQAQLLGLQNLATLRQHRQVGPDLQQRSSSRASAINGTAAR